MKNRKPTDQAHPHDLSLAELRAERTRLDALIAAGKAQRADASRLHQVLQVIRHIESAQAESAAAT
jgi:hypothetical protein